MSKYNDWYMKYKIKKPMTHFDKEGRPRRYETRQLPLNQSWWLYDGLCKIEDYTVNNGWEKKSIKFFDGQPLDDESEGRRLTILVSENFRIIASRYMPKLLSFHRNIEEYEIPKYYEMFEYEPEDKIVENNYELGYIDFLMKKAKRRVTKTNFNTFKYCVKYFNRYFDIPTIKCGIHCIRQFPYSYRVTIFKDHDESIDKIYMCIHGVYGKIIISSKLDTEVKPPLFVIPMEELMTITIMNEELKKDKYYLEPKEH